MVTDKQRWTVPLERMLPFMSRNDANQLVPQMYTVQHSSVIHEGLAFVDFGEPDHHQIANISEPYLFKPVSAYPSQLQSH